MVLKRQAWSVIGVAGAVLGVAIAMSWIMCRPAKSHPLGWTLQHFGLVSSKNCISSMELHFVLEILMHILQLNLYGVNLTHLYKPAELNWQLCMCDKRCQGLAIGYTLKARCVTYLYCDPNLNCCYEKMLVNKFNNSLRTRSIKKNY